MLDFCFSKLLCSRVQPSTYSQGCFHLNLIWKLVIQGVKKKKRMRTFYWWLQSQSAELLFLTGQVLDWGHFLLLPSFKHFQWFCELPGIFLINSCFFLLQPEFSSVACRGKRWLRTLKAHYLIGLMTEQSQELAAFWTVKGNDIQWRTLIMF